MVLELLLNMISAQTYSKKTKLEFFGGCEYITSTYSIANSQVACNLDPICIGFLFRSDWAVPQGWLLYRTSTTTSSAASFDTYFKNGYAMTFAIDIRPGILIDVDMSTTDVGISNSDVHVNGDWFTLNVLPLSNFKYSLGSYIITLSSVSHHMTPVNATGYSGLNQFYLKGTYTLASCTTACFQNSTCNYVYFVKSQLKCGLMSTIDASKLSNTTVPTYSDFTIVQKSWSYDSNYYAYPNSVMSGSASSSSNTVSVEMCQTLCAGCLAYQFSYVNGICSIFNQISTYSSVNQDVTLFLWNSTTSTLTEPGTTALKTSVTPIKISSKSVIFDNDQIGV